MPTGAYIGLTVLFELPTDIPTCTPIPAGVIIGLQVLHELSAVTNTAMPFGVPTDWHVNRYSYINWRSPSTTGTVNWHTNRHSLTNWRANKSPGTGETSNWYAKRYYHAFMRANRSPGIAWISKWHAKRYSHTHWLPIDLLDLRKLPTDMTTGTLIPTGVPPGLPIFQELHIYMPTGTPIPTGVPNRSPGTIRTRNWHVNRYSRMNSCADRSHITTGTYDCDMPSGTHILVCVWIGLWYYGNFQMTCQYLLPCKLVCH
jgi:hypothetical protein